MTKKPRSLLNVVKNSGQLGHLARMLNKQQALLEQIQQLLPAPINKHCIHARISGNRLILHTSSPVWATRLRFHAPEIISAIKKQAPSVKNVDIRIILPEVIRPGRPGLGSLPEQTSRIIEKLADSIDDEAIQAALKRLCNATSNKN